MLQLEVINHKKCHFLRFFIPQRLGVGLTMADFNLIPLRRFSDITWLNTQKPMLQNKQETQHIYYLNLPSRHTTLNQRRINVDVTSLLCIDVDMAMF